MLQKYFKEYEDIINPKSNKNINQKKIANKTATDFYKKTKPQSTEKSNFNKNSNIDKDQNIMSLLDLKKNIKENITTEENQKIINNSNNTFRNTFIQSKNDNMFLRYDLQQNINKNKKLNKLIKEIKKENEILTEKICENNKYIINLDNNITKLQDELNKKEKIIKDKNTQINKLQKNIADQEDVIKQYIADNEENVKKINELNNFKQKIIQFSKTYDGINNAIYLALNNVQNFFIDLNNKYNVNIPINFELEIRQYNKVQNSFNDILLYIKDYYDAKYNEYNYILDSKEKELKLLEEENNSLKNKCNDLETENKNLKDNNKNLINEVKNFKDNTFISGIKNVIKKENEFSNSMSSRTFIKNSFSESKSGRVKKTKSKNNSYASLYIKTN